MLKCLRGAGRSELFYKDVLALRVAHDELLRTRQDRCARQIHRVDRVEEPRQTVLRWRGKVVVESKEKHGLFHASISAIIWHARQQTHHEYLDKRMWRTYCHGLHHRTSFEQHDLHPHETRSIVVPLTFERSCHASSVLG